MAKQEEPLYDFPEPTLPSERKVLALQRGRGSLRSISVLDRLLLTVPVWLQLSINPATALHILRREPPGTFLVRKSRTYKRNVLCVRLADDSVPSFVQQFGIKEEQASKTLCLETSVISFPDLPRLIAFYCVSRDVLPFPLELPGAIGRAKSHKELESISHMGIEFWSSHLNVRGPRDAAKPRTDEEKKPDSVPSAPPAAAPPAIPASQPDSATQPSSDGQLGAAPEPDAAPKRPGHTLFQEFCPITTRSPLELDCGPGLGALCFINPLFLQAQNALSFRQRQLKRSLKVRVSTETSTLLSPPLASPPPPPLIPKAKRKCKVQTTRPARAGEDAQPTTLGAQPTTLDASSEAKVQPAPETHYLQPESQERLQALTEPGQSKAEVQAEEAGAQIPTGMELLSTDFDYMTPPPSSSPSLSPYMSPAVSPMPPPLFPKMTSSRSPRDSPCASPSLSPYQSPSVSPRIPFSLSPYDSPNLSPSCSPLQSPSPSPMLPMSLSPFISASFSQLMEEEDCTYATPASQPRKAGGEAEEEVDQNKEKGGDLLKEGDEDEGDCLASQMSAASLNERESCSPEKAADSTSVKKADETSLERTKIAASS